MSYRYDVKSDHVVCGSLAELLTVRNLFQANAKAAAEGRSLHLAEGPGGGMIGIGPVINPAVSTEQPACGDATQPQGAALPSSPAARPLSDLVSRVETTPELTHKQRISLSWERARAYAKKYKISVNDARARIAGDAKELAKANTALAKAQAKQTRTTLK